jgi:N-acyl homoserine lactone hydrolase
MSNYRIRPLQTGTIIVDKGAYVTRGIGLGTEVEIPGTCWYLTDGEHKVMVDTGMCHTKLADWHHHGSRQDPGQAVDEQLKALGVDPAEIEMVIFTHLHWDHCHNLDKFTNARFVVSAAELAFALEPIPPYYKSYEYHKLGTKAPFLGIGFETVDGEKEILPGISVFPTPGHSPGHQAVAVDTDKGLHIIAGDAIFAYDNLEPASPHLPFTVPGRFADIIGCWKSIEEIVHRSKIVLPGHDKRVMEVEEYPV